MRIKVEKLSAETMAEKRCPTWSKEVSVFDWEYDATETYYVMEDEVKVTTPRVRRWNSARAIWSLSRAG